jgi:CBS domain-containing protein
MLVEKVYRPGAVTCAATDPLQDVAAKMAAENVGALAVMDGDVMIGVISERDLAHAVAQQVDPAVTTTLAFASRHVQTALPTEDTSQIARRMLDAGIRHLPVVRENIVLGVISMRDLLAVETWL